MSDRGARRTTVERRQSERRVAPTESLSPTEPVSSAGIVVDRRDTAKRNELRFLVAEEDARRALGVAARELRRLDERPWYTTTYCDTPDRSVYRAALAHDGVMLRIREYADARPERILGGPLVWIEWKRETASESQKWRFVTTPDQVRATLRGDGRAFAGWPRDIEPVVVTQCRREAYESRRGEVRVTADREVAYRRVSANGDKSLLGPAIGQEEGVLVEVKWLDTLPEWTERLIHELRDRSAEYPAKFLVAMHHLLSSPPSTQGLAS